VAEILVLGGYGNFGKRIVELLVRQQFNVIIAGRNRTKAAALAEQLRPDVVQVAVFDVRRDLDAYLQGQKAAIVINTVGPFQSLDYEAAKICMNHGIPYIDLADGRDYVAGIGSLDQEAKAKDTVVISGASTVPALTSAVVEHYLNDFEQIDFLDFGIAPGQRTERGLATTKAILGYAGKKLKPSVGYPERYGWQDTHRRRYPVIGSRWMSNCDVPDLDLLPPRYGIERIRFSAGMEVPMIHFGIWALSWLVRMGVPLDLTKMAEPLLKLSDLFDVFGSADGGMHIVLEGRAHDGHPMERSWFIIAKGAHGPYIPAVPAVVVAKKILSGELSSKGAMACVGLMTLKEFLAEVKHLEITTFKS
jgi:hypothetical protein